tara:strand:+ start:530 stop:1108 length:579 start_codon:yes stop_codon:yes gene_type:complete
MLNGLKFLNEFFTQKKYESDNMTITLDERACYDIRNEDYRFRVKIAEVIGEIDICYRDIAIEDHHQQTKHQKPHLQFKLHADGLGHIHIFLPVENAEDYKKYILSFLDTIGSVLIDIDNPQKKLQTEFMIMKNFKKIEGMSRNIKKLIYEQYQRKELRLLDFNKEERKLNEDDIKKIKEIPQIAAFFEDVEM